MKAFLTGSRAYGLQLEMPNVTPETDYSDIDVVVVVTDELIELFKLTGEESSAGRFLPQRGGISVRFGKINLLCVSEEEFPIWERVTKELIAKRPVKRYDAVTAFKQALGEEP